MASAKSSKLLEETLQLGEVVKQTKRHLMCAFVNVAIIAVLSLSILNTTIDSSLKCTLIYQGQCIIAAVLTVNFCFHLFQYSIKSLTIKPVCLSPTQRKLMGVHLSDRYLKASETLTKTAVSPGVEPSFSAIYPMNLSATSWLSPTLNESPTPNRTNWTAASSVSPWKSPAEPIMDELALVRFIESVDQSDCGHVSLTQTPQQVSPLLRRQVYQAAPVTAVTLSSSPGTLSDEGNSPASVNNSDFWRRVGVDPRRLTQWNANLRMWISLTILQRVVAELDHIDTAFVRCGLSDLHLGSVGLDRLKRTACIPQVIASIPSLPRLVPFLELSAHQEYLVTRIRELAAGGSMSEFRWNSGGSLHGKTWEEHLPTDAALVMHLVATYLDLQMRPDAPTSRPFSTQCLVRSPERPPTRPHGPVIHQTQLNPPHFIVIDKDEQFDVPKGRNNVLHAFLMFLHLLKTREHGMLGPVNLGRSGVNVLWVTES